MLDGVWRKRNTFTLLVGGKLVQPLWKTVWQFLKDLEIEIPFDPAIPLLGIYPKDYKSHYWVYTQRTIRTHAHECSLQHCLP